MEIANEGRDCINSLLWQQESQFIYNCIGKSLVDICQWCDGKEYRLKFKKPTAIHIYNKLKEVGKIRYVSGMWLFHVNRSAECLIFKNDFLLLKHIRVSWWNSVSFSSGGI